MTVNIWRYIIYIIFIYIPSAYQHLSLHELIIIYAACFCTSDHIELHIVSESMRQEKWSALFFMTVMFAAMAGVSAKFTCPRWSFHNVSVTPCTYSEVLHIMSMKYFHPSSETTLRISDDFYITVVKRHTTPELCVLRSNSSYFDPQTITSVEQSPLCSPEQQPDCIQTVRVNYSNTTVFGVSVWDHNNLSAHYLIVNESTELILKKDLTSTSFNLQNLFDTALAFHCKRSSDSHDTHSVDTNTYARAAGAATASAALVVFVLILGFIICFLRRRVKSSR